MAIRVGQTDLATKLLDKLAPHGQSAILAERRVQLWDLRRREALLEVDLVAVRADIAATERSVLAMDAMGRGRGT